MNSNYKKLGDYIQPVNRRNTDLKVETLLGVSIQKILMPSIANTVGTNMKTYKIIVKNQFAYGPVTSRNGDKISIALLQEFDEAIISQAYTVFEVVDTKKLHPEYLMMWFRRPEFDRYARFKSHGSARETFDWDELCEVELPIPSIEKQNEIVNEYNTVTNRIKLNEQLNQKLEETAQALYKHWFVDFEFPNEEGKPYKSSGGEMVYNEELDKEVPVGWDVKSLSDFGEIVTGKTPSSKHPEDFGKVYPFVTPGDFNKENKYIQFTQRNLSEIGYDKLKKKSLRDGDVIVTCIGSDMGKVALAIKNSITNQQMNSIKVNNPEFSDYLYYYFKEFKSELKSIAMGSSTMPMISKSEFEILKILKPKSSYLMHFMKRCTSLNLQHKLSLKEIKTLQELQSVLLSKMSKVEELIEIKIEEV